MVTHLGVLKKHFKRGNKIDGGLHTDIAKYSVRQPVFSIKPVSNMRHLSCFSAFCVLAHFYSNSFVPLHILSSVQPHMWTRLNASVISYENSDSDN